jgi:ribosomal protein S18 acetylase RimI-like enzyme
MQVRRARVEDLPALGKLAGGLVRMHEGFDSDRFMHIPNPEAGYERFLRGELADKEACVMVAADGDEILGYTYSTLEGRDWNALLDACGQLHDIFVRDDARGRGVGDALLRGTVAELLSLGAPRVVLATAVKNEGAQRFFESHGFRRTMIEMTFTPPKKEG